MMRTGMLLPRNFFKKKKKRTEGQEWEELHCHYREMSKATRAKKPSESPKAKALWDRVRYAMIKSVKKKFGEEHRHV